MHVESSTHSQSQLPEEEFADQLEFLSQWGEGVRPPGWKISPQAVVNFICGAEDLQLPDGTTMNIPKKFIGSKALVERCVVTLAGSRGLMLVGEPGTAKSMLSELLSAAICGSSTLTVQGSAGTTEDHLRYGWNYGILLTSGPSADALVPSPVMEAMQTGKIARIEEITRCQPEIQDSLIPMLSERRMAVPELTDSSIVAHDGFAVIATANLRDKGVSEMSAALKRRFNFEQVEAITDRDLEIELVMSRTHNALPTQAQRDSVDKQVVEALVTMFQDLRKGITAEGWSIEKPSSILSTAEAVAISTSIAMSTSYFPDGPDGLALIPGHLLGAVVKDDDKDRDRIISYFDIAIQRRAESDGGSVWEALWEFRDDLRG